MVDSARPLCDCPEPCACYTEGYAAGKRTRRTSRSSPTSTDRSTPKAAPANPARSSEAACRRCLRSWPVRHPGYPSWWKSGRWGTMTAGAET